MKITIKPFTVHVEDIKFGQKFYFEDNEFTRIRVSNNLLNEASKDLVYVCSQDVLCFFDPKTLVTPASQYSHRPVLIDVPLKSFFIYENKVYMKLGIAGSNIEAFCFDDLNTHNIYRQTLVTPCIIEEIVVR